MATRTNVEQTPKSLAATESTPRVSPASSGICHSACPLVGRVLLSLIFVMSGVHKIMAWDETATSMEQEGLMYVPLLLLGAMVFELGGGLSVMLGLWARVGAVLLIAFLIPTTLVFHDFWTYAGDERQTQMIHFMKNLAILGGVFLVLAFGSGRCSLDGGPAATRDLQVVRP